ncbi:hypothetical protein GCM10027067_21960 [Pseudactinotalea suaedae]
MASEIRALPFSAFEAVDNDTPATLATSLSVTFFESGIVSIVVTRAAALDDNGPLTESACRIGRRRAHWT